MRSGSMEGYGDVAGRLHATSQSLAAAGFFPLELPGEYTHLAFQISGGNAAARSVLVGMGGPPEPGGQSAPFQANDVFDPTVFAGWKKLDRATRWVYVYVVSATAGATLHVIGCEGEPVARGPSASEIAAAIAAAPPTTPVLPIVWSAPVNVNLPAAVSTSLLAANAARQGFRIQNVGANSVFYRKVGSAASAATDIELLPDAIYEEGEGRTLYRGEIRGISTAGSDVRVEEAT